MRVALLNPSWSFEGSIYFGCRSPHLPLELAVAERMLAEAGHSTRLLDAHLFQLSLSEVAAELTAFEPDIAVVTTAPTYLFWRCAPPELRVPQEVCDAVRALAPVLVAVGPHGSTAPRAALRKLGADIVVMGECEETLTRLAGGELKDVPGTCYREDGQIRVCGQPMVARFLDLPPLAWPQETIARHLHHHHRFDAPAGGPGAEVEASRGCPYSCTFCAKENFRNRYRRRHCEIVLEEVRRLRDQGAEYVYFIDEIFLPHEPLLRGLADLDIRFGIQTRIDLWSPEAIELLGRAGCVSVEAGIESLTPEGRESLDKRCRLDTEQLAARLITAKRRIPFVQANLIEVPQDDDDSVQRWRRQMRDHGIWANDPVPLFPYPGSPDYRRLWGLPDDEAWERALDYYLRQFSGFSDIQDTRPRPLRELEREPAA
jgi:B12-binding domain/radical SAM domain protein of rhizo-twelve system